MAPIGGGPPVGSGNTFTGTAQALEIYGDFGAAYSGQHNINTSKVQHLKFTTGNYLFLGELQYNGPMKMEASGDLGGGDLSGCEVSFNGVSLFSLKIDSEQEGMPTEITMPILIPAYTEVEVGVICTDTTAGFVTSVNLTGRIYT